MRALLIVASVVLPVCLWTATRSTEFRKLLRENKPVELGVVPPLMSAAVGPPARRVGYLDDRQVAAFIERGGRYPLSGLDIRAVPGGGTPRLLWVVDPGISFLWNLASRFGLPLSIRALIALQIGADFAALALVMSLAGRCAGWLGAGAAGLLYGTSLPHAQTIMLPSYYFWSIPIALLAAWITTAAASRRGSAIAWGCGALVLGCALWLRLLWFPVGVAFAIVAALFRRRERWKGTCLMIAVLTLSYFMTVVRASGAQGGDLLHPRSQLWHTLYIGLGYYGTFGEIRWQDEYAIAKGREAGIDQAKQQQAYDRHMRTLFLQAVESRPFGYAGLLLRRFGDYLDLGRFFALRGYFGGPSAARGYLFLLVVGGAIVALERRDLRASPLVQTGCLYLIVVAIWTILIPPQYAAETTGLVTPLVGAVVAAGARRAVTTLREASRVWS